MNLILTRPATKRAAAAVLRGAGDLILTRGHRDIPSSSWTGPVGPSFPIDVAGAMCLTRFGVNATGGWAGKHWRLQDRPYRLAHDTLSGYLMAAHHSDVCGWNRAVPRARDVIAVLWAVAEDLHAGPHPVAPRGAPTRDRVRLYVARLDRMVADGSCPYPLTEPTHGAAPVVVVPDVVPAEWVARP